MANNVSFSTSDRQWDIRLNVPDDSYLQSIVENIMLESTDGKIKYVLIGGIEIGTRPAHTDYQCRHVHIAVIFNDRVSKSAILKNWGVIQGHGFYMVPRNRDLPYSGWRDHHIKEFSKVDTEKRILYEHGQLPKDIQKAKPTTSDQEKKRKIADILVDMRTMLEKGEDDQCFAKYPRNYLIYGARLKAMAIQQSPLLKKTNDPHIWLHGFPGSGKSTILRFLYPGLYRKDLSNRFWDLFEPKVHTHVLLEDLDPECMERLGLQFLKTICDEGGFPYDQKYKTPQVGVATILVSSNYTIPSILPDDTKDPITAAAALHRRFLFSRIDNFLRLLNLKLIDKFERMQLKKEGNTDESKLFIDYDYVQDCPTGKPLKELDEYRQMIRNAFYH